MGLASAEPVAPGVEGGQGAGVVLAQEGSELVGDLLAIPGGILLSSCEHGDGAAQEHESIAGVGLLAGDGVPVAVAGGGHRVDCEDPPFTGPQHGHQQAGGGLDRDGDRTLLAVAVLGEQIQQDPVAGSVVGDVSLGQQLAAVVDLGDVVCLLVSRAAVPACPAR